MSSLEAASVTILGFLRGKATGMKHSWTERSQTFHQQRPLLDLFCWRNKGGGGLLLSLRDVLNIQKY
jgi:hypothetical protein